MNRISVRISSNTILISLFLVIVIVLPNATTISRVAKVCFGIISLIYIFVRRQIFWSYYINWLILTVLLAMCSVIWAISSEYASDGAQTIFFNAVCTFSFIQLLYYNDNWKGIVYRCCAVFPFIRFLALVPEYGVSVLGGLKNIGQDTSYNALGSFGGLGAAICVLLILRSKKGNQIWKIFLFLNIFVCGITMSRKAILYLVIPLLIYYFLSGRNSFIKIRRIVAIIFAIALFYVAVMNVPVLYTYVGSGLESVMKFFNNTGSDSSAVGRSIRIQYGLGWFSPVSYTHLDVYKRQLLWS